MGRLAYIGALVVVLAIRTALESRVSLNWIASCLPDTSVRDRLAAYAGLLSTVTLAEAAQRHGVSGYVVESVPFALFAASRVRELGFVGMLEQIIAAGGDTDTNASLAGQVAGTALGLRGLPKEFVARLPQAELVFSIAGTFAERTASRTRFLDTSNARMN